MKNKEESHKENNNNKENGSSESCGIVFCILIHKIRILKEEESGEGTKDIRRNNGKNFHI
jgi:hypothetical protein